MSGAWSQLEQLLTCAICLDRYRNPKLLPCHHTYCQEPCLDGLVDYARRQIKCPECRAEHRIPYNGVQTFPTNVTLVRFLELHRGITGEEPEPIPSMMERCSVCNEKSTVERCAHCDKKVCPECKEAHLDIIKREVNRINSQVRRALNRLTESVSQTEKNVEKLLQNKVHIREEVEEIVRRFLKDLKERESKLLHDLEEYVTTECKNLTKLKEDLDVEATNMASNCELIEKHVLELHQPWTDVELVEYKDILVKTLDFLRNFDPDTSDYTRKIRFTATADLDILRKSVVNFGELKLPTPEENHSVSPLNQSSSMLSVPSGMSTANALMRSQSDHRLVAQFARQGQEVRGGRSYLDVSGSRSQLDKESDRDRGDRPTSPLSYARQKNKEDMKYSRFAQGRDDRSDDRFRRPSAVVPDWPRPDDDDNKFRSRFLRDREDDDDFLNSLTSGHRSVRFEEPSSLPQIPKVFDTMDAPRGPLSGVVKLADTAHLMTRLHELEIKMKQQELEKKGNESQAKNTSSTPSNTSSLPPTSQRSYPSGRTGPTRQLSEDEIDKQKKANQVAAAAASAANSASHTFTSATQDNVTPAKSTSTPDSRFTRRLNREEDDHLPPSGRTVVNPPSSSIPDVDDDDDSALARYARRRKANLLAQEQQALQQQERQVVSSTTDSVGHDDEMRTVDASPSSFPVVSSSTPSNDNYSAKPPLQMTSNQNNLSSRLQSSRGDQESQSFLDNDQDDKSDDDEDDDETNNTTDTSTAEQTNSSFYAPTSYSRRLSITDTTSSTPFVASSTNTSGLSNRPDTYSSSIASRRSSTITPVTSMSSSSPSSRSLYTRAPTNDNITKSSLNDSTSINEPSSYTSRVNNNNSDNIRRSSLAGRDDTSSVSSVLSSLRRREGSPYLTRQATVAIDKPYSYSSSRDYGVSSVSSFADRISSLRSRSPSTERELNKIDTNPSTPTRRTFDRDYTTPSSSRYITSSSNNTSSRNRYERDVTSPSTSFSSSTPRSLNRLARSSTVGDMLGSSSRSSRYAVGDSSTRDFSRRSSPVGNYSSGTSSGFTSRRPPLTSSLTLSDATSNYDVH